MKLLYYFALFLLSVKVLNAEEPTKYKLRLSYSLLDIPQNFESVSKYPSMMQSIELSSDLYDLSFWGINALGDEVIKNKNNTTIGRVANTVFKYLAGFGYSYYASELPVPLGVYTHEEFHRSVLGVNDFSALNGNWIFNRWDGTVYGLNDEDLTLLKQNDISALLYSYVSGVQSENYLTQVNVIQDFFHPRTFYKNPYYLYNAYYVWDYFNFSAGALSDSVKVLAPPNENANPYYRDYAGADLTAWIYDMFSPGVPYTNRDPFPDGEGVNRRIGFSDLTVEGQKYLKNQKNLSLLNFANPAIFLINRIKVNPDFNFLFFMQYSPTHFGNDIALFVPFQRRSLNHLVAIHNYNNREKKFVGLQYGIYNIVPFNNKKIETGGMINIWNQPSNQGFFDQSGKVGGAIELMIDYSLGKNFSASVTTGYKTKGWMIGNPYIDQKLRLSAGIKYFLKDI
jgi:hypothetical protein